MADLKGVFLHESDEWSTPKDFYESLNDEFQFDLDPCATEENHKCPFFFTKQDNGLVKNWGGVGYFAIHRIQKYLNGLRNVMKKGKKKILLLCF